MPRIQLTPLQRFRLKWARGCGSALCSCPNTKVVLCRGSVPAEVVFVGEAPGLNENAVGLPFKGPAGKKLDRVIMNAFPHRQVKDAAGVDRWVSSVRYAITNLVGCVPRGENGRKTEAPFPEEIKRCRPRLVEFIRLCRPRLIVQVGGEARRYLPGQSLFDPVDWLPAGQDYLAFVSIEHPASILRKSSAHQSVLFQKCSNAIRSVWEDLTSAESRQTRPDEQYDPLADSSGYSPGPEGDGIPF